MTTHNLTRWISTTPKKQWRENPIPRARQTQHSGLSTLRLDFSGARHQTWEGFGGCFNELSWIALSVLGEKARLQILAELFHPEKSCRFTFCRLPIGASDYGAEWYSHNEHDGDFAMRHFSIERDRKYLIPYIKAAQRYQPRLKLFASPWSPPTWMKFPKAHNFGTLIWEKKYLDAYALYFLKFVQAYRREGITINQIHVQNEPLANQKFPSCLWTAAQLRDFIRDHLGPLFRAEAPDCEIWLGTLNTDDFDYPNTVLVDERARQFIRGVGFQWAGKGAIQQTHESYPQLRMMQTENECGDGKNSWDYARYTFNLFRHYINNGAVAHLYWNMVLEPGGLSTWGWNQNALITVEKKTKTVAYTPEFYVMKHFSHFVKPGATQLGLRGEWTGNAAAFENPDGKRVVAVCNPFAEKKTLAFGESETSIQLEAQSFNTLLLGND